MLPEPEQDRIVAGLLTRLWQAPANAALCRPLQVMCDAWAAEFQQRLADTPRPARPRPGPCRDGAVALPARQRRRWVLLCTDLHAWNILAAEREPWLVIDPKRYLGDPTYDALQHLLNCGQRLLADPIGSAHRMADLLDLDADRLKRWQFARCLPEPLDQPILREVAAGLDPT